MDLKLNGKTALVTGSTAGIGLEIARSLAVEGAQVVITGRDQAKLDEAIASIKASGGAGVRGIVGDSVSGAGVNALMAELPQVDILINNLGIYESKAFADLTDKDWLSYFDINVMSGVRLSRAYFPRMLARNWGRVIFISSESAITIPSDMIHYATTKTAQLSVARGLANLTKGTGVTVNAVMPGPTRSEGIVGFLASVASEPKAPAAKIEAEFFEKYRAPSLLQRLIEPQEIATTVAYLASPLSAATNGSSIHVEGGLITTIS
ncbi:SDR family NAD(P)-dependent oxidoreductase [Aestuariivirga litoralis]|uniref:SDR family NAD(P)-dependent oxidoreductase n=1 Tax=Aestuariivirga litoralis TaxID=2650924 RepID=UPI0018C57A7A|nr:SDR family oxidoreductase [Aestuariivirga litoralis]MBG1231807.1 SDR family oxidoreductase [Aestuariivirga litoralis]